MGGKSSAPPPPDYAGAAAQTAAGNKEAAVYAVNANRATQNTPYGTLSWDKGTRADGSELWTQNVNLSDTGQKLLNADNASKLGLAGLQATATDRVAAGQAKPFDYSNVQAVSDDTYKIQTDRMNPQWDQREAQLRTQLANQGITPGSEAYNNEMKNLNQGRNDAFTQARLQAYNMAPTQMQLATSIRSQPLNELNALRTGSQVNNPTFSNYAQQQTTAGPDMLSAANMGYQAQVGQTNANNANSAGAFGGLMSIGSAAAPFMFSDERLKKAIKRVGTLENGVGVYVFTYIGEDTPQLGCIAQDVMKIMPDAVKLMENGFYAVNYAEVLK